MWRTLQMPRLMVHSASRSLGVAEHACTLTPPACHRPPPSKLRTRPQGWSNSRPPVKQGVVVCVGGGARGMAPTQLLQHMRAALPLLGQRATHRPIATVALDRRSALCATWHRPRRRRCSAAQQLLRCNRDRRRLTLLRLQQQPADATAGRERAPQLRLKRQAAAQVGRAQLRQQPGAQQRWAAAAQAATGGCAPGWRDGCICVCSGVCSRPPPLPCASCHCMPAAGLPLVACAHATHCPCRRGACCRSCLGSPASFSSSLMLI